MKVSEEFLIAKKDKEVRSIGVFQRMEPKSYTDRTLELKTYIRLGIEKSNKYNSDKQQIDVCTDTEIHITNFSGSIFGRNSKVDITRICFTDMIYNTDLCHYKTFLSAIKKDSDVSFEVIAYNSSESIISVNWVSHQIYGIVDNKKYFLKSYTGPDNSASPVS